MNYVSTKTINSRTAPGVRIVLRRMNDRRKEQLQELQEEPLAKLRTLMEEYAPLNREWLDAARLARAVHATERQEAVASGVAEKDAYERFPVGRVEMENDRVLRWGRLQDEIRKVEKRELEPIALRYVLLRIECLEIDGVTAGLDEQIESGDQALTDEIVLEVKRELGLLPQEAANLSSPSTSPAAVDGKTSSGTALTAETPEKTLTADAVNSTGLENASARTTPLTP
jgi:hypothetical protein